MGGNDKDRLGLSLSYNSEDEEAEERHYTSGCVTAFFHHFLIRTRLYHSTHKRVSSSSPANLIALSSSPPPCKKDPVSAHTASSLASSPEDVEPNVNCNFILNDFLIHPASPSLPSIVESPPSLLAKLRGPNSRRRRSEEEEEAVALPIPFDKMNRQWLQSGAARRQGRASSVDYKETMRSLQKLKEAPRLSLDSKLSFNSSPAVGRDLPTGRSMFRFSGNVVAKLMGLDELPSCKNSETMASQLAHTNNYGNHAALHVAHANPSSLRQPNPQQVESFYYENLNSSILKQRGFSTLDDEQNIESLTQFKKDSNLLLCNHPEQVKRASEQQHKRLGGVASKNTSNGRALLHIGVQRNPSINPQVPKSGVISAKPGIAGFSYQVETSRGLPQDITSNPSRDHSHSQSRKLESLKTPVSGKEESRSSLKNNCGNSSPLNSKEYTRRLIKSSQSESNNKHKSVRGRRVLLGSNASSFGSYCSEDANIYCSANSHYKWPSTVMESTYSSSDSSHFKDNSNVQADNLEQQPSPVSVLEVSFGSPSNTYFDLHHYSASTTPSSAFFECDDFHDCLNSETETVECNWVNDSASQEPKQVKVHGLLKGVISTGKGLEDSEGLNNLASPKSLALIKGLLIELGYGKGEQHPHIYSSAPSTKSLALINELLRKVEGSGKGEQHSQYTYSPGGLARHAETGMGRQNRSLLHDVLWEVLRKRLQISRQEEAWAIRSSFHGRKVGGSDDLQERLLKEVLLEVGGGESDDHIYDSPLCLVRYDLSHPAQDECEWREFEREREEIGVEIERLIVKDLIEGIAEDLVAYASPCTTVAPRKSATRQLFTISDPYFY